MKTRIVIIGAGVGGLAAAMRLGAKGWRVTVIDRLDRAGGRGSSISRDGHRFDLGPTIVTVPQVFEALWAACGRDFHAEVDLRPLDPFYTIRWPDGSQFNASGDETALEAEVMRLCPSDLAGYRRFMRDAAARYAFGFEDLGRRPMHKLTDTIRVLHTFVRLRADRSVRAHAAARVRDPRLRMALSFHPLFIGGDPARVTSIYALVGHLEKAFGVHYAIGGVQAIADAMAEVVRAQGGELRLNVEADEILVEQGAVRGVRVVGGETLAAPLVVSNADPGQTYGRLMRRARLRRWTDAKLGRRRWSMGLYVWYFGTRGTKGMWPDLGHHTILAGPRYEGLLRDVFRRGQLADDMSVYLHRPAVTDPGVAPPGDDTFYALSPVPHLGHRNPVDWEVEREPYRRKLAAILDRVMPGFEPRIVAEETFTPLQFKSRYLAPHGSGFSIEPRILQSAWFRPHNVSEEARGLYLVGAGTHPGAGLPGVVCSAEVLGRMVPDAPGFDARAAHLPPLPVAAE
jgi:phytoene desaturase